LSPLLRQQRLEVLSALIDECSRSGADPIEAALDALVDATAARRAAAFANDGRDEPRAERRLGDPISFRSSRMPAALRELSDRAFHAGSTQCWIDVGDGAEPSPNFSSLGARCVLCVPLPSSGAETMALLLLFDDRAMLDEETRSFVDAVAGVAALARDRAPREKAFPHSSGPVETSRGPELELYARTIAQELSGPVEALGYLGEELGQLESRLRGLLDPGDRVGVELLADFADVQAELSSVAARVGATATGLLAKDTEPKNPSRFDLGELVSQALSLSREKLDRRGIRLDERIEPGSLTFGRRGGVARVVQNLLAHSARAAERQPEGYVGVRVFSENQSVVLEVETNGTTAPQTAAKELEKPLSQTSAGVELKLAIEVVAAHGGHVEVSNLGGGGSSFRVVLPGLPVLEAPTPSRRLGGARPRKILIVDDEPMFARSIRRALRPHDVRLAGTASEAELALLDSSYEPDLVVCDVFLPGRNGNLLHERIRSVRPEIAARFVFVTGGALGKDEADYLRASGCPTLFKPLDTAGLLELLESRGAEPTAVRTLAPSQPPPSS
jgi:signal transduction histidine kinase/ActR/RegA family two-component response regulator